MFAVVITEKGGAQRRLEFEKNEVTIGRVQGNDIILPKGNVSKRHSRIVLKDNRFIVVDLKSTNGTYVNGRKITSPLVVKAGDKIYIGDFILTLEESMGAAMGMPMGDSAMPAPSPGLPPPTSRPSAPPPLPRSSAPAPSPAPMPGGPPMHTAPMQAPMPAPAPAPAPFTAPGAGAYSAPPMNAPQERYGHDNEANGGAMDDAQAHNRRDSMATMPPAGFGVPGGMRTALGSSPPINGMGSEVEFWRALVVAAITAGKNADEAMQLADFVVSRSRSA